MPTTILVMAALLFVYDCADEVHGPGSFVVGLQLGSILSCIAFANRWCTKRVVIMKAAVFAFFVLALCAVAIQASPLEDTLGAFMRAEPTHMANVSDPAIAQAYADVRSDASETTWVVLKYVDKNTIGVAATGAGTVDDLKAHLPQGDVGYAYLRVTTGDNESKRAKFVLVAWVPDDAPVLRKAKQSVHKADVKSIFKEFALEVLAAEADELNHDKIVAQVVKAGGANYMGQSPAH